MRTTYVANSGPARNAYDEHADLPLFKFRPTTSPEIMTPGAREIHRRTRWSASLCNAVAAAWAFGSVEA